MLLSTDCCWLLLLVCVVLLCLCCCVCVVVFVVFGFDESVVELGGDVLQVFSNLFQVQLSIK